jgi:hypothetical protein
MSRLSLDANVLIYRIDASDPAKDQAARRVVAPSGIASASGTGC